MGTLLNGIKDIFATAKTTGSNVMLCGNDGTPDGHITMANLASVLGAITTRIRDTDLNNVTQQGVYYQYAATPSDVHQPTQYGFIRVIAYESELVQIFSNIYDNGNRQPVSYIRNKMATGWSAWHELAYDIPSFYKNYSDINSLYSVINGMFGAGEMNNINANDITKNCIGSISAGDQALAMNYPLEYGFIIHLDSKGYFGTIQIGINSEATQIWTRKKGRSSSSTWSSWSRII